MYERRSGLSSRQQSELIKPLVAGATVRAAGGLAGVHRNTAATCFMRLRRLMASRLPGYRLSGETEEDESCFGGVRKGKRGRGAAGKIAVSGPPKRRGKVYTAVIPNAQTGTLLPVIMENAFPRLKRWRGIATRHAKNAASFLAAIRIRCIFLWASVS